MSTRRLFLPAITEVSPVWIYGGPNNGGIWLTAFHTDNTMVLLSADQFWQAAPGIYLAYGDGGKAYATTDANIMPPSAVEAQGMALVVKPDGTVNSSLLGTFVSPNDPSGLLNSIGMIGGVPQFASLPTSIAMITISGVRHLMVAGLFSFYLKAGLAYTADGIAAIDLTTGLLNTGFTGLAITPNASFGGTTTFPPQVFSDGDTHFGLCGIGTIGSAAAAGSLLQYTYAFTSPITAGSGTFLSVQAGGITPPIAKYGATGFNGPFTISDLGAFGTPFPSARMALGPPCLISAGVFMQDSFLSRPNPDPPTAGTFLGDRGAFSTSHSGSTFLVTLLGTSLASTTFYGQGGSTGGSFTITTASLAAVASAVAGLFPECTLGAVTGDITHGFINFTVPTGMTYSPDLNFRAEEFSISGISRQNGPGFISLASSDGVFNEYIDLNTTGGQGPLSTAIANDGTNTCYVFAWVTLQWSIKILGVIRINVASASPLNSPNSMNGFGLTNVAPVSVVPFNNGFAVSLPYLPIFGAGAGTPGAPVTYKVNPAVASAATVTLKCPIIVIDSAGVIDTAFDAALWTNFFSLVRTDGARFGSMSLSVDNGGNLYFGSLYIPTYLDPTLGAVTQTTALGDVTPIPIFNPLTAGGTGLTAGAFSGAGPGLEVLCACDTAGGIIQPA